MVLLGVCPVHLEPVKAWAKDRAMSDGTLVQIEDLADFEELVRVNERTGRGVHRSESISNRDGGVALVA